MIKYLLIAVLVVCVIILQGCNTQTMGGVVGGATGGLLGNTIGKGVGNKAAIATGAIGGAIIGSEIGRGLINPVTQSPSVTISDCSHITNTGVRASCERGSADKNRHEQREAEQRAYQCARYRKC